MKILKLIPMLAWSLVGKQVRTDYESQYIDADKPKLLRRRYLGLFVTTIGGIMGSGAVLASGQAVTPELLMGHVQRLADAGMEIAGIIMGVKASLVFMWGVILLVAGVVFKKT